MMKGPFNSCMGSKWESMRIWLSLLVHFLNAMDIITPKMGQIMERE